MSVYDIAFGVKRSQTTTKQYRLEWEEIVQRLKNVTRTDETMAQYAQMSKSQKVDVKDVGFFIGGLCVKRKVTYRQLLVIDIDEAAEDTLKALRDWLAGHAYVIHSTHSSTPDDPRYRVVVPLNRIVLADEYGAVMRVLHDKFKLPLDVSTFDFNRIMFLPSIPKDAEYFFEYENGEELDVTPLLEQLDNWQDLSDVPVPEKVRVQDPKYKGGLVGAFCAKVSIREAIETYLQDVWRKERSGRYTLIGATTVGGGVIYEDKYLYSNHSSDPYLGRCHNAYDAVRLYKFGEGKQGEAAMASLCESLGIRADSGKVHRLTIDGMDDEEAKAILNERLEVDSKGNLEKTLKNAQLILKYDSELRDIFAYDLFSEMPVLKRTPSWRTFDIRTENEDCRNIQTYDEMTDTDESYLRLYFEDKYGFDARAVLADALNIVEHENAFHPVRDYLNSLKWDGVKRLETIFIDCFGVPNTLYTREVGKKFFTGAVRRVFIPASKMDYIPVLVSEEGFGKSKFIRRMAKLWGSDTFYTFNGSKEAYEQLRGVWIMEIPELNGVQSKSTNSRKAFVTKGEDRYRSAYLKYTKTYKRQCVFIASSNDVVFLDDPSEDGRRWWGMICNKERVKIDVHSEAFLDLVDQYWAEAVHYYLQGVLPVLSEAAEAEARQFRTIHKAEDSELGALIDYLNMPVPVDWYKISTFEHKQYWLNSRDVWSGTPRQYVCTTEVAREFYEYERKDMTPTIGRKVADAIRRTQLFDQTAANRRFGEYGSCVAWIRRRIPKDLKNTIDDYDGFDTKGEPEIWA